METKSFTSLTKAHPFTQTFKSFKNVDNKSSQTPESFFSFSKPNNFPEAEHISVSKKLLEELGLENLSQSDISFLSGQSNKLNNAFVTRYGGHQFGHWAGQLGDGRAHTLGQFKGRWDVQVKGSGPNPYSRSGDGYAVLRSSVREFLMSEYMHHLGVPTTRALNLISTSQSVLRDMFYDGNAAFEPGALVTRLAPTFLRFGHFQIYEKAGEVQNLQRLVAWTIENHFPNHKSQSDEDLQEWFDHICKITLDLVVQWMRVGFVHGVLNTDNMSIIGLTIDYGPFSMLDEYDRSFTPNTTDLPGRRYSFENQPAVCLWNLERLAEALKPLVSESTKFSTSIDEFKLGFKSKFETMFQKKLGLPKELADPGFIMITENLLHDLKIDFTLFFSNLSEELSVESLKNFSYKSLSLDDEKKLAEYTEHYKFLSNQMNPAQKERLKIEMKSSNPKFNLRNYILAEVTEDLNKGSKTKLDTVMKALESPYDSLKEAPELYTKRPKWADGKPGCGLLSCSS